jgi:phage gp36-like protein
MAVTSYITSAELQLEMSASGVSLRVDDDATATAQCIADASIEADGYALLRYSRVALAASDWYKLKVKHIAQFYLCTRRQNPCPQSAQIKYEKAIADLEKVQLGKLNLPDVAGRKEEAPVLSNQRVRVTPFPRTVTERGRSTGTPEGYTQADDTTDVFDYTL